MRVVYMGSPEFAIPPLQQLLLNGHQVAAVYTPPDKPAGRGLEAESSPVKLAALSWNLPVIQLPSLKTPAAAAQLAGFKPEAVVVAAFGQMLPSEVLAVPCYGCLNLHPSLLPKYRGPSPVPAALLAGDAFAGVSLMRLDAGMDTGPVFARAQISILPFDDIQSLLFKLFQTGGRLLTEVLSVLPAGRLLPEPQNAAEASSTHEISKEDGQVDWARAALHIWRQVRAYASWPGAYTHWQGKKLKLIEVVPLPPAPSITSAGPAVASSGGADIGRVIALPAPLPASGALPLPSQLPAVGVVTGDGVLGVLRLQIEGKKALSAAEFLRGQRNFVGSMLQ